MGPRRRSMVGSAAGLVVACTLWLGLARLLPAPLAGDLPARLGQALAALLPAIALLHLMVIVQMALRVSTRAVDPLAGRDGLRLQVNQRVLTNTVEQLAGFAPGMLALAAGVTAGSMPYVIAAGWVFAVSRLVFWGGYMMGPMLRAPGMAATFVTNLTVFAAAIWVWWP